jgi:Glycosyl transferase family 2
VLYLAIPAHNEVATIGVLLWRLRTVLAEFPREYEVVVYDDASTDETAAVAEQYERAMPVSVIRGATRLGYAGAVDALLRHVAGLTRYPRRDAVLLLQGDFTDPPGIVPEFARRFEGGADLVVGERLTVADAPMAVKRLFKYGHWAMRPFVKVDGVKDLTATMRLVRISALREAIRVAGTTSLVQGDSWTANTDLLLRLAPHARKVESVPMEPTYGVRMRETRRVAMTDAMSALKWAWGARGRRAVVGSSPVDVGPEDRRGARQGGKRREEPAELSVERIREKVRERDGSRGIDGEPAPDPRRRRPRERAPEVEAERPVLRLEPAERPARADKPERPERLPRGERPEREKRTDAPRTDRPPREPRSPRPERSTERSAEARPTEARPPRRRDEPRSPYADATLELDDPFAPPSARREARSLNDIMGAGDAGAALPSPLPAEAVPLGESQMADAGPTRADDAPAAITTPRTAGAPLPAPVDGEEGSGDDGADEEFDGPDAAGAESEQDGEADSGELDADGQPRRKRRRNRRSRRGRRKKDGRDATDTASDADASASGTEAGESDEVVRFLPGDHIDGEPVRPVRAPRLDAAEDDGDDADDADDDDGGGVESMSEGAPRPRRRGRRGRRGGARRSRGKKDRPEGESAPEHGPEQTHDGDAP